MLKTYHSALFTKDRVLDFYIILRFYYRIGQPLLSDDIYEQVQDYIKQAYPDSKYLTQTYDDDPIPYELLKEFGQTHLIPTPINYNMYYPMLNEDKSLSIRPVVSYKEAYDWYYGVKNLQLILMLKMDGVYTKSLAVDKEMKICLSRGRSGDSFDFTSTSVKYVLPRFVDFTDPVRLYGEAFVPTESLDVLKLMLNRSDVFSTTKGGALTLLRVESKPEAYSHVKQIMFDADGLPFTTKSEILDTLKEQGFLVTPYLIIEPNSLGNTFEEFTEHLRSLMDTMYDLAQTYHPFVIPTDGLVLEVNDKSIDFTINHQYSSRNIALKFEYWAYKYYKGVIEDIILTPRRTQFSVRVKIKRLVTDDRCKATILNVYNLKILNDCGLSVGSTVYFKRASNAYNNILYGDELNELVLEGGVDDA